MPLAITFQSSAFDELPSCYNANMSVIDEYLQAIDEPNYSELQRVRRAIHNAAPDASEVITYAMPGFKYKGKYLISFAAFKNHFSLFPGGGTIDVLQDILQGFKTSKGTIQFTIDKPLSDEIIAAIVKQRIYEIENA